MDSGKIKNVCETFTDGWKPDNAQKNMEQCLTSTNNKVDAVLSENDGMASGVGRGSRRSGPGWLRCRSPARTATKAAINRVALGTQTVSIWKNSTDLGTVAANAAIALADGTDPTTIEGVIKFNGGKGVEMNSILLAPTPITKDNIDGGDRGRPHHQGTGLCWC